LSPVLYTPPRSNEDPPAKPAATSGKDLNCVIPQRIIAKPSTLAILSKTIY
jgi:hypothetical protein